MKNNIILFMLLFSGTLLKAQSTKPEASERNMAMAKASIDAGSLHYNPAKAFGLFKGEAEKGNAQAMNAIGLQYSKGLGTEADLSQAIIWYEKAGQAGYSNAWNNLGYIHKEGLGIKQDFIKAFSYFVRGASMDNRQSIYMTGYMYYKGLGSIQDYTKAVEHFRKASKLGSVPAMYFLGLSFRNGYGVEANADSARYWLQLAQSKGDKQSIAELSASSPENALKAEESISKKNEGPKSSFQNISEMITKQGAVKDELAGLYTGHIMRYDWSGQHLISKSNLTLRLNRNGKQLEGLWTEDDALQTELNALLSDSKLIFNGTSYSKQNHYRPNGELLEFRDASLRFAQKSDTAYLEGTLRLWSSARNEPSKPAYISLTRIQADDLVPETIMASDQKQDRNLLEKPLSELKEQKQFVAYPNPFNNNLQVAFSLDKPTSVNISLISMNGQTILQQKGIRLSEGSHVHSLNTERFPVGSYVLKLEANGTVQTTVVIKN